MVGSVLMGRMHAEGDFSHFEASFFSTSGVGQQAPVEASHDTLLDAHDLKALASHDIIVTAQGGDYTEAVYQPLRASGWKGVWIDAAKTLRMQDDAVIILDPINHDLIEQALARGVRNFNRRQLHRERHADGGRRSGFAKIWWSGCHARPTRRHQEAAPSTCANC